MTRWTGRLMPADLQPERSSDRTVHARLAHGAEIVRYDRAGKWYLEHNGKREQISIDHAAGIVTAFRTKPGGVTVFPGLPGGSAFDRRVGGSRS